MGGLGQGMGLLQSSSSSSRNPLFSRKMGLVMRSVCQGKDNIFGCRDGSLGSGPNTFDPSEFPSLGAGSGGGGLAGLRARRSAGRVAGVLAMREEALNWRGSEEGLAGMPTLRIYASEQTHSSIDKAVRLAGIGQNNLVKVKTDSNWAMCPTSLQSAIENDQANGLVPAGVIGCIGGTSIGASDHLHQILKIARQNNLYSHVDAAWAGSAMICPEFRSIWKGIEMADSIVFNPHKWLGANFDCSIQFLKEPKDQIKTLAIKPTYLQTLEQDRIDNYSEWCIPLGRRFRALKLWFLIRSHGLNGLQEKIRNHIKWAGEAAKEIEKLDHFSIVTPPMFSLFTFRFEPPKLDADQKTRELIETINADGRIYLTHTSHDEKFVIRFTIGQFDTTRADVQLAIEGINELANGMS